MATALGVDIGVRKGLDAVLLNDSRSVVRSERRLPLHQLRKLIRETAPDVVAIDSPPRWADTGKRSRETERLVRAAGILSFATPAEERGVGNRFYEWMTVGFEAFQIAEACGYPRYRRGNVQSTAIEVFPHATAVCLAGALGPSRGARVRWRRRLLSEHGVAADPLIGPDQVDAALAALTGLLALEGSFHAPGDPGEGVIVVPVPSLPAPRYVREVS